MCNNQCLKQWPRPVDVRERRPTVADGGKHRRVLAWNGAAWEVHSVADVGDEVYFPHLTYWMRLPPNPEG